MKIRLETMSKKLQKKLLLAMKKASNSAYQSGNKQKASEIASQRKELFPDETLQSKAPTSNDRARD